MKGIITYSFWIIGIYVAYCGLLFMVQRKVMYPRHLVAAPPITATASGDVEKSWIDTAQGKIESWFLRPRLQPGHAPAPAVVFAHGNAELIDYWPDELAWFSRRGMGVLLIEYPGYGRSQGSPSQQSITEAFTAGYDMLVKRSDVDPARIVLFGRSLGGGAVCALSTLRPSAGIILMSTFTSARSFASSYMAPGFLILDPFDNLAALRDYPNPVLVVHGEHDEIIPFRHGKALSLAARQGQLISYPSGHNDCPPDWDRFWRDLASFLSANGIIKSTETNTGGEH